MCDTLVIVEDDVVWLAKNSDREPGEAQGVEHHLRARPKQARLHTTYLTIDQVAETNEVVLSRPMWMWGAEMGQNEHGLAIGNEAVFTKVPHEPTGLLGMDLVRLALERTKTAEEALDLVTWMLARHGQGGVAGFRHRSFRYHNAFVFADRREAWLLETAGRFWAAERIGKGVRTTSNVLTIGEDATRLGPGTVEGARSLGLLGHHETFDFRKVFADPIMSRLSGGDERRACTARAVTRSGSVTFADVAAAVRDHAGRSPESGARVVMPCAHASWLPTRGAGQTTGTQVSRLSANANDVWLTGTSAPCLSVLKPVPFGTGLVDTGPPPNAHFEGASLFWRGERLHRTVLRDYEIRRASFEPARAELEARATRETWSEHRHVVLDWTRRAEATPPHRRPKLFDMWWRRQSSKDGIA